MEKRDISYRVGSYRHIFEEMQKIENKRSYGLNPGIVAVAKGKNFIVVPLENKDTMKIQTLVYFSFEMIFV